MNILITVELVMASEASYIFLLLVKLDLKTLLNLEV